MSTFDAPQDPSEGLEGNGLFNRVPKEILDHIADFIKPEPDPMVSIDWFRFVSVLGFDEIASHTGSKLDVRNLRLVCRRFADVGARILYARVVVRFSTEEFERLETLATREHLAHHVKKLTYLVPYFYGVQTLESLRADDRLDLSSISAKASMQKEVLDVKHDLRALQRAIKSFKSLQLVKILRICDQSDTKLSNDMRRLSRTNDSERVIDRAWQQGFSHCLKTLGIALQSSDGTCTMFYSPHMSIQSAQQLKLNSLQQLRNLVAGLTCLVVHFDDCDDVDRELSGLSEAFKAIFASTTKMRSIHIGFSRPTNIPLELLFDNIQWTQLTSFGIDGWSLTAEEILGLSSRHEYTLNGLRLQNVSLKGDGRWRNVLIGLRNSNRGLRWLSLRGIDYAERSGETTNVAAAQTTGGSSIIEETSESTERSVPQCSCAESFPDDNDP